MQIRKFQLDRDLQKLEEFLRNQYLENKNMTSWLPERLHDRIYRMSAQEADGRENIGTKESVRRFLIVRIRKSIPVPLLKSLIFCHGKGIM